MITLALFTSQPKNPVKALLSLKHTKIFPVVIPRNETNKLMSLKSNPFTNDSRRHYTALLFRTCFSFNMDSALILVVELHN